MKQPLLRHCLEPVFARPSCWRGATKPNVGRLMRPPSLWVRWPSCPVTTPGPFSRLRGPPSRCRQTAEPLPPAPMAESQTASERKCRRAASATLTASPVKPAESKPAEANLVDHQEAQPAAYAIPVTGAKEDFARRRSYADITAKPCFSHSPDYSWVKASCNIFTPETPGGSAMPRDEEDNFGGGMTLVETGPWITTRTGNWCASKAGLTIRTPRTPVSA